MSQSESTLVLYIPAYHNGYEKLFEQAQASRLYILGPDLIKLYPVLEREIRQVEPEIMARAMRGLGHFKEVRVATADDLLELGKARTPVILSEEDISDDLISRYFSASDVTRLPVFLRWDKKYVSQAVGESSYDTEVTEDETHTAFMERAALEANKSSDWFRQIGAALVIDGDLRLCAHNSRVPSPHEALAVGDPRLYVEYGTDLHAKTALHAEESLIIAAARQGLKIEGAWVYSTVFPCAGCAGMLAAAGIRRLYFKEGYAALGGDDILKAYGVEIVRVA